MSKVETLVSQYKNELKYAGPFYISHEGFGAAPLGQIDYPALSMAFAEWLDARGILPEIVGWSNKTGFCDADAAGYAAAFPANENGRPVGRPLVYLSMVFEPSGEPGS